MRKSILTVLAALSASGMIATPAAAEQVSVKVSTAGLDLAAPAGARALGVRIAAAVDQVCARPDMRSPKAVVAWEACRSDARASAREQIASLERLSGITLAANF